MIYSMTGFGKAEGIIGNRKVTIQLKSLNSKQTDITVKLPSLFREQELLFRKRLSTKLGRGKIELYLNYESEETSTSYVVDEKVFENYFTQLKSIEKLYSLNSSDLLTTILKMPDVVSSKDEPINDNDSKALASLLNLTIDSLISYRKDEGSVLGKDLESNIQAIEQLLKDALVYETERTETVKKRLYANLEESLQKENINADRFEQEMIYYIEKYDISEEKVRLKAHCSYFLETMNDKGGQGKKLGFIAQEIGREINTLGSKANHASMQKLVVQMKDHLEKIKEQVLNVL